MFIDYSNKALLCWYFDNPASDVSSNFVIGPEGEIIQCIPLYEKSSAGNHRNQDTILPPGNLQIRRKPGGTFLRSNGFTIDRWAALLPQSAHA